MNSRIFSGWKNLLSVAALALLFAGSFELKAGSTPSLRDEDGSNTVISFESDERRIFDLINLERAKGGLPALGWNSELTRMARGYSRQMADGNFFSHYDPRGLGVVERAQSMRIRDWNKIGENLFYFEGSRNFNQLAVKSWMRSPTHRRNILDAAWTTSGIGIGRARDGRIYITQVFISG